MLLFLSSFSFSQEKKIKIPLLNALNSFIVRVKASPELETKSFGYLNKKDEIEIVGVNNLFFAIKFKEDIGYIHSSSLKKNDSLLSLFNLKNYKVKRPEIENTCHYFKNEVDEFSGKRKKITENYNLSKVKPFYHGDVHISLRNIAGRKYVRISLNRSLGCAVPFKNSRSSVKIKLNNGKIVSFYHAGDVDCGDFSIFAKLTKNDILKLKASPIKTIRFQGKKYYHDKKNIFWDTFFIDKLDCIE